MSSGDFLGVGAVARSAALVDGIDAESSVSKRRRLIQFCSPQNHCIDSLVTEAVQVRRHARTLIDTVDTVFFGAQESQIRRDAIPATRGAGLWTSFLSLKASMERLNRTMERVNELPVGTDILFDDHGGQTSVITVFGLEHIILLTNLRKSGLWDGAATCSSLCSQNSLSLIHAYATKVGMAMRCSHPILGSDGSQVSEEPEACQDAQQQER